jgi:hypothetical protein
MLSNSLSSQFAAFLAHCNGLEDGAVLRVTSGGKFVLASIQG